MCPEYENSHFSHIFFQHGYLTYYSTYLLKSLYVYSLDVSGGKCVSNFDKGLSFCFSVYRRWKLEKNTKKHKSYPFFVIK